MKKRKTTSSSKKNLSTDSNQKSIKNFFKPAQRPSLPFDINDENFLFKEEPDSDSDIEIIECTFSSINKTSSFSNFKRNFSEQDDEVIVIDNFKKFKVEKTESRDSLEENSNSINQPSTSSEYNRSDNSDRSNKPFNDYQYEIPELSLDDPFSTPIKKKSNETYPLYQPSPYFKKLSDTLNNSQNYNDINAFLSVQLEEIQKSKTPNRSDKKVKQEAIDASALSSVKKDLLLDLASPAKSNQPTPAKVNLKDKKELAFSEVNRINFNKIIKTVIDDTLYKCLFNNEDLDRISIYLALPADAQSLFIKLFFRKHTWIRRSAIKYDELTGDLDVLLNQLLNQRFLVDANDLTSLEEGLHVLDGPEVKEFAKQSKVAITQTSKSRMIDAILNFVRTTNTLSFSNSKLTLEQRKLNELKKFLGDQCFKVNMNSANVLFRMILLYFPPIFFEKPVNSILSETFFHLYEDSKNLITFPIYDSNKTIQVYSKRDDLIFYTDACILEALINENGSSLSVDKIKEYLDTALQNYEDYIKANLKLDMNLPYFLRKLTAGTKLLSCISQCITLLEKNKRYKDANQFLELLINQNIYCLNSRGKWYDRLITNYESHLKDEKKAYEFCTQAFSDYYVREAPKLMINKKLIRLAKKLKLENPPKLPELNIPEFYIYADTVKRKVDLRNNIFYEPNNEGGFTVLKVEQVALNYYLDEFGYTGGLHSENQLFNTLFFLLFYEEIFIKDDSITDIYRFNFQKLPLDFGTDNFYESRKSHFESKFSRLVQMSNEELFDLIKQEYLKYENLKTIINLNSIELEHLKEIVICIDIEALMKICRRLAEDHRFTRSGFPDLIVWNLKEKKIKAVEVKGPGDSLSEKQMLWIDFLNSVGLQSEVCFVKAKK